VDFAIITALEEERDAVLAKIESYRKLEKDGLDTHTYYEATIASRRTDGASYRVVVTSQAGMGPIMAAQKAQAVVARWHPRHVLLVGIACGLPQKTNLGDVLVSTQIADYVLGKVSTGRPREIRWVVHPAGANLLDTALNLAPHEWVDLIAVARPGDGQPARHANVIASGGDVVSSAKVIQSWKRQWAKLIGIEMEAGGVASGLMNTPDRPEFLMIKGVSDHGEGKESVEQWRPYASDVAASFALALIRAGVGPAVRRKRRSVLLAIAVVCAALAIVASTAWLRNRRAAEVSRLVTRGVVALKNGDSDVARQSFDAALQLDSGNANAHANLATLDLREGRLAPAVAHAEAAVKNAPNIALYHYNLARVLVQDGRLEDALPALTRAVALDPGNAAAYNEMGNIYLALRRPADAYRVLNAGLRADATFPPLWKNLGRAALDDGKAAEALQFLGKAAYPAADWRGRAETAYWMAVADADLHRRDDACGHLREFRRLDRDRLTEVALDAERLAGSQACAP
jgi:nucleoside phosphorylase/Tfp pilus assembly protein PilF